MEAKTRRRSGRFELEDGGMVFIESVTGKLKPHEFEAIQAAMASLLEELRAAVVDPAASVGAKAMLPSDAANVTVSADV